jgi:flagellar basal body-associated protein FliL
MEFNMNRGSQSAARPAQAPAAASTSNGSKAHHKGPSGPAWLRVIWVVLLFAATILIVAIAFLFYSGGSKEGNFVDKDKQQAVFLTNGQVYFGKIQEVNSKYLSLTNIYYLNVNQQVQPNQKDSNGNSNSQNSISLVKLGCELHGPVDKMIINREQVTFWENLKSDGQVAKAISQWAQQNPNGQKCETPAAATNTTTTKP